MNCASLEDLLFENDPQSLAMAARHAQDCPGCSSKLTAWNELSTTAQSMEASWNNDMLWPRIERALKQEKRQHRLRIWQAAAALLLTIGLAAISWRALSVRNDRDAFDSAILRQAALGDVERTEHEHLAAIDRLEKLAEPRLDQPATPLLVTYKEKLMVLDQAIDECQTNIDHNRQNAHLRKQLLAIYSEKQRTLQDVLREENHVSQQ
jgi:hypothetical protein